MLPTIVIHTGYRGVPMSPNIFHNSLEILAGIKKEFKIHELAQDNNKLSVAANM